jgi:hypothetical protein
MQISNFATLGPLKYFHKIFLRLYESFHFFHLRAMRFLLFFDHDLKLSKMLTQLKIG